ncbi:helix-turn-helix transcriptional regulator [Pasteurella multocida]|uniref:Helix-turn-helix transcriptional regulator n=1 Tax=Pasteurella multocida TaxID=747 RepID=A0AAW8VB10_PASMD|nr:helix-turn-helix transcriptional regulator [Pasteurella multocida]MDT3453507.1 helix-turn-helix transcriptional regulator [Pasteurella multocida]MDY0433563.1 helix-turn-helix transcriptional regulator [Pasteurella multocida]MDY0438276.1 helix-turn-helix transcriptional regulator [Pasteurella multocida]MDY0440588.1 helix-turn-helix transcriptional regulator [Pasteurella multocida]MDY0444799.1 helix-turn-helix transcriptional regulator [Pasteurella multocida]
MNKIAQIRNKLGITQSQLAEKIGWGQPRIANYEAGIRMPSLAVAQEIVKALNAFGADTSIDDVFPAKN